MEQHADRLVLLHVTTVCPASPLTGSATSKRRLPMETGVMDSRAVFRRLNTKDCGALCMIEPFEPGRTHFHALTPEAAVREAAALFAPRLTKTPPLRKPAEAHRLYGTAHRRHDRRAVPLFCACVPWARRR